MARTVQEILDGTNVNVKAANCLIVVENDVDEELAEMMIAFSEPDGSGNIIALTKIAPRSVYQYVISGFCVSEIGGTAYYKNEPLLKFDVRNAGPNQCFTQVPFAIVYVEGKKLASIKADVLTN